MATTINDATLTVAITEDIVLGGTQRGSRAAQTVTVDEFSSRLLSVGTSSFVDIVTFSSAASAGTFIAANVKYLRVTNLDASNFIELLLEAGASANEAVVKLKAGESFVLGAMELDAAAGDLSSSHTLAALTAIEGKANSGAVDIEVVVASS